MELDYVLWTVVDSGTGQVQEELHKDKIIK